MDDLKFTTRYNVLKSYAILIVMRQALPLGLILTLSIMQSCCATALSHAINPILSRSPAVTSGVLIEDLRTHKTLYAYHADHLFTPASNTKLFSGTALLLAVGPDFRYQTSVYSTQMPIHGTLKGNLVIKFSGDPSLTSNNINTLIHTLSQKVHTLDGQVYLQVPNPRAAPYGLGETQDSMAYCFAAPIGGIIINENCTQATITTHKRGHSQLTLNPGFTGDNQIKMVWSKSEPKTCVFQPHMDQNNCLHLKGCLKAQKQWAFGFAIQNPMHYAQYLILKAFKHNNIHWHGQIIAATAPIEAKFQLASHQSAPLSSLLKHMLTYSDNVYAGAMTQTLGEKIYGVASTKSGVHGMEKILQDKAHLNFTPMVFEDGAGLSRYNLVSPSQLVKLLSYIDRTPTLKRYILPALPVGGKTGTLRYRINNHQLIGRVIAKTGSESGVLALSGYLEVPRHHPVVFSMIFNGFSNPTYQQANRMQQVLLAVYHHSLG